MLNLKLVMINQKKTCFETKLKRRIEVLEFVKNVRIPSFQFLSSVTLAYFEYGILPNIENGLKSLKATVLSMDCTLKIVKNITNADGDKVVGGQNRKWKALQTIVNERGQVMDAVN
jgi:hypothetical protein